jgi:hypothetical protein
MTKTKIGHKVTKILPFYQDGSKKFTGDLNSCLVNSA